MMTRRDMLILFLRWYGRTVRSHDGTVYYPVFGYDGQVVAYGEKEDFWRTYEALAR